MNTNYAGLPHPFEFRGETVTLKQMSIQDDVLCIVLEPPNSIAEEIIRKAVQSTKEWQFNTGKVQEALEIELSKGK